MLTIIFAALVIMRRILHKKPANAETLPAAKAGVAPAPTKEEAPVEEAPADDGAVVAAIIAAICAHTGKPASAFRVVSFKKIS